MIEFADVEKYLNLLSPIAIGVFSFLARQVSKKMDAFDALERKVNELFLSMNDIRDDLSQDIADLKQAQTLMITTMSKADSLINNLAEYTFEMKSIKEAVLENVVIKRDLASAWKDIDSVRSITIDHESKIKLLKERTHWSNNKLMILKFKAEKAGWEFKDDWNMPQ